MNAHHKQFSLSFALAFAVLSWLDPVGVARAPDFVRSTYTYKTIGGLRIRADVYRKPDAVVRPAILWLHGGGLITGNRRWLEHAQAERYIDAGYAVIAIDYRLAPHAKLPLILEDLDSAYHWVRQGGPRLFRIDPDRIAIVGHSAGGYLALMAGFRLSPRPKAIVSFYGYGDVTSDWSSKPDPFYNRLPPVSKADADQAAGSELIADDFGPKRRQLYLYLRQQGLWPVEVVGRDPAKEASAFHPFCPLRNIAKDYPPTLLLHGDKDTDVPIDQSALMAKELARHGVPHDFITVPGLGHGFDSAMWDPAVSQVFDRVLMFLGKQLRPN
jgi:acetyl esterase/lipase